MIERHDRDERLRAAFQSLGDTAHEDLSAEEIDRVWRAVSGELPAAEREELVDRMAREPALAEAWRAAQELWGAVPTSPSASARAETPFRMQRWMAAAAALVVTVAAGAMWRMWQAPAADPFRDQGAPAISSLVPAESALPRDAFLLRWTPGPAGSRYDVRVTTDDLRVLAAATDRATAEFQVESNVLSGVPSGARILWQVDVHLPSGDTQSSETFIVRVQ